jgi:hypothetical protein
MPGRHSQLGRAPRPRLAARPQQRRLEPPRVVAQSVPQGLGEGLLAAPQRREERTWVDAVGSGEGLRRGPNRLQEDLVEALDSLDVDPSPVVRVTKPFTNR